MDGHETPTRGDWDAVGSEHDSSKAVEGDTTPGSAAEKGKGKESPSSSSMGGIQSSGGYFLGRALSHLSDRGAPILPKEAGSPSTSSYEAHQSIYGSKGRASGEIPASSNGKFKPEVDANHASRAEARFNAFARDSSNDNGSLQLGHLVAPSPTATPLEEPDLDGADVARLLSQPETHETPPPSDHENPTPLHAASLQEALSGPPPPDVSPSWDRLLDLRADFLLRPDLSAGECKAYMGTSDIDAARAIWIQQWNAVLSSYTDHVWGDLGTLAKDAKSELAKIEQDETRDNYSPSVKALERLRLVLAHLRGN